MHYCLDDRVHINSRRNVALWATTRKLAMPVPSLPTSPHTPRVGGGANESLREFHVKGRDFKLIRNEDETHLAIGNSSQAVTVHAQV